MAKDVEIRFDRLRKAFLKAPQATFSEMQKAVNDYLRGFARRFVRARLSGRKGVGKGLNRRTGSLVRAFVGPGSGADGPRMKGTDLDNLRGTIGWLDERSGVIATVNEDGATIRPRTAGALKVPLSSNLTPAGVVKDSYEGKKLVLIDRKGKPPLLAVDRKTKGPTRLLPVFILLPQVVIPPRLGFAEEFTARSERNKRTDRLNRGVQASFRLAGFQTSRRGKR